LKHFPGVIVFRGREFAGAIRFSLEGVIDKLAAMAIVSHDALLEAGHLG